MLKAVKLKDYSNSLIPPKDILIEEFDGMCYLCEESTRHIEIDHFFPQKFFSEKKNEWSNLFLSCQKCNKIKGERYNIPDKSKDILNNLIDDVENLIFLSIQDDKVEIKFPNLENVELKQKVKNTVELLERIYNGVGSNSKLESIHLRKIIGEEIKQIQSNCNNYRQSTSGFKNIFLDSIKDMLDRKNSSKHKGFISFKKRIIENDYEILKQVYLKN